MMDTKQILEKVNKLETEINSNKEELIKLNTQLEMKQKELSEFFEKLKSLGLNSLEEAKSKHTELLSKLEEFFTKYESNNK